MSDPFASLRSFALPAWSDMPEGRLSNTELCRYVNSCLAALANDELQLTPSRVQNYLKWGFLPAVQGRKYERKHLASCLVIALYKRILPLQEVRHGMLLQQRLMPTAEAYTRFAVTVNDSFSRLLAAIPLNSSGPILLPAATAKTESLALTLAAEAFARSCLLDAILRAEGYGNQRCESQI